MVPAPTLHFGANLGGRQLGELPPLLPARGLCAQRDDIPVSAGL